MNDDVAESRGLGIDKAPYLNLLKEETNECIHLLLDKHAAFWLGSKA